MDEIDIQVLNTESDILIYNRIYIYIIGSIIYI